MIKNKMDNFVSILEANSDSISKGVEYLRGIIDNYNSVSKNTIHNRFIFQNIPEEYLKISVKVVSNHFDLNPSIVLSTKSRQHSRIKHLLSYIANKIHNIPQEEISIFLNDTQPSINVGIKKIEGEISVYPKTNKEVSFLADKIVLEINYLID